MTDCLVKAYRSGGEWSWPVVIINRCTCHDQALCVTCRHLRPLLSSPPGVSTVVISTPFLMTGVMGLYSGLGFTLLRAVPVASVILPTYDAIYHVLQEALAAQGP
jgi:hypothetical protein